jgi:hypothetical protein
MMKHFVKIMSLILVLASSCQKPEDNLGSSVRIVDFENALPDLKMAKSNAGNLLIANSAGAGDPLIARQQFSLLKPNGDVIKKFTLTDTSFQFLDIMAGLDGGFFVAAAGSNKNYVAWYKLNDNGAIQWFGSQPMIAGGAALCAPSVTQSFDGKYLLLYQNSGAGYFILKIDASGALNLASKVPPPAAQHPNIGLNFGEAVLEITQPNNSTILLQGEMYDQYSGVDITNCFIRKLTANVEQQWFSTNYDTANLEVGAGMFVAENDRILFFGTTSESAALEGYGDIFIRSYSQQGTLENEKLLPRVGGTPTIAKKVIPAPGGGYLMVGSNNQFPASDLVSPNKVILLKLKADLTQLWSTEIPTVFPGRGFDLAYLNDGTIGVVALHKEDYSKNRIMYFHLDANGNIIP